MDSIVQFLTGEAGIFAAVVAALGLVAAVVALVRPFTEQRRKNAEEAGQLEIIGTHIGVLYEWSNTREMRFTISNAGNRPVILLALRVHVDSCSPSETVHQTRTAAPVDVYQHRVELSADRSTFDIRERTFGGQRGPLNFEKGETSAFMVKLVSRSTLVYKLRVEAEWYDIGKPQDIQETHTEYIDVDFPQCTPQ